MITKYATLTAIHADESRAERELRFSIQCKNTGRVHKYDLNGRLSDSSQREILAVAALAMYRLRDSQGHLARTSVVEVLGKFLQFLKCLDISTVADLDRSTLSGFAEWLKNQPDLSYSTAASMYRKIAPLFVQMSKHPSVRSDFQPVRNAFPKSSELVSALIGYDQSELKQIVTAAVKGMRESAARLEKEYVPKWKGMPAPVDDVAPVGRRGRRSFWASEAYRVWWWENKCNCERVNSSFLAKIYQGQSFLVSLSPTGGSRIEHLEAFYNRVGAGADYRPKYRGLPCPIRYGTPWQKKDYLVWYWENFLNCKPLSGYEAKESSPVFYNAIKDNFGSRFKEFFEGLGVTRWVQVSDLIPYYLMLLIRTQLNPSTLQRLEIDCLSTDPTDTSRMSIDWTKFRSSKRGLSIPSDTQRDGWPVTLIKRVTEITDQIRIAGQKELWLSNLNPKRITSAISNSSFKKGLQKFSEKYDLKRSDGTPLSIQARLIRPTLAWNEYIRTEDMMYLQTMLGHAKLSTTSLYLRRLNDPILTARRAVHQDAMYLGLKDETGIALHSVAKEPAAVAPGLLHEGVLNHCQDPLRSPVTGQKAGRLCSAGHEVCLGCQNLVITHLDIKKYFCFIFFHEHLLQLGDIDVVEYDRAIGEKRYIWEEYILPRYDEEVVERARKESIADPLPEWNVALYESKDVS